MCFRVVLLLVTRNFLLFQYIRVFSYVRHECTSIQVCGPLNINTIRKTLDPQTVVLYTRKYNYFISLIVKMFSIAYSGVSL